MFSILQGEYLGKILSDTNGEFVTKPTAGLEKEGLVPFKYRHIGSFAYVGDNKAVLQLPIVGEISNVPTVYQQQLILMSSRYRYT